jgi:hypothetical protein
MPPEVTTTPLPLDMQEVLAGLAGAPTIPRAAPPTSMMPLMDVQRMMEAERQRRFREMLARPLPPLR